jgi:cytochrome c biogenesis protein CcmG, thiol:disulfide interchange protein DsbE
VGVVLALGLTAGLFVGIGVTRNSGPVGSAVPSFSRPRVGGSGMVGVPADGGGNGRPAILLFFASWCGPCHEEIPQLARVYNAQHADGSKLARVAVIGLDESDPPPNALAFMSKSKVSFPVGADEVFAVMQGKFGFGQVPDSVFVQSNGTIAGVHLGALTPPEFVAWEHTLLTS